MSTRRELAESQLTLMNTIRSLSNINMVTCGNCGTILLHEMKPINDSDNSIECFGCKTKMELCDCPDYWYDGMIDNLEFDEVIELEKPTITFEDVVTVAIDLKMNPSIAEIKEVLKYYPNEEKESPDMNWTEIVENILYNVVTPTNPI